jgi:hypothetical protein
LSGLGKTQPTPKKEKPPVLTASLSIIFAALFLFILILLHFIKRELDPSWRMISEYEIGRFGWLMRLAFFCWGTSVLALLVNIRLYFHSIPGTVSIWWFALIVLALFGAGIFKTDPITNDTKSLVNTIHKICGTVVILTFPIAATLATIGLLHDPLWSTVRTLMLFSLVLAWVGMLTYFATIIIARSKNRNAGLPGGPTLYMGWPNRFNVLTYIIWIMVIAFYAMRFSTMM